MNGLVRLKTKTMRSYLNARVVKSRRWLSFVSIAAVGIGLALPPYSQAQERQTGAEMPKIQFVFKDKTVSATLNDSASAQDFARQLPLTLNLEDYANIEKIAYLPSKLTIEGAPKGASAKTGDLSYYAPWGNLVVFYKDFSYSPGLIKLGEITTDLSRFTSGGDMSVTIELATD